MEAGRGQASTKPREKTERAQGDGHRGKSRSSGSCAGNRKRPRGQQRSRGRGTRRTEQDRARHGRVGRNRGAGDDASRRQRELGDGPRSEQGGIREGLLAREKKSLGRAGKHRARARQGAAARKATIGSNDARRGRPGRSHENAARARTAVTRTARDTMEMLSRRSSMCRLPQTNPRERKRSRDAVEGVGAEGRSALG
jgi:hypothetical protein